MLLTSNATIGYAQAKKRNMVPDAWNLMTV